MYGEYSDSAGLTYRHDCGTAKSLNRLPQHLQIDRIVVFPYFGHSQGVGNGTPRILGVEFISLDACESLHLLPHLLRGTMLGVFDAKPATKAPYGARHVDENVAILDAGDASAQFRPFDTA